MMVGRSLNVAMVGCGEIAYSVTARSVKQARNARLTKVMDIVPELAASMGEAAGVPWTSDLHEVLRDPSVDAVLISTPHDQHEPLTIASAAAGKHVMCEKPIACTLDQAERMIAGCEAAGVQLGINMIARYEAVTRAARELVASGAIGRITGLNVHFSVCKPEGYWTGGFTGRSLSPWRRFWATAGGGVLMMNMVHELDRLCFISGLRPVSASAEIASLQGDIEVEDVAAVAYRFDNGALGSVTASSCAPGDRSFGAQIIGTHGQVALDVFAASLLRQTVKRQGRSYALRRLLPQPLINRLTRQSLRIYTTKDVPGLMRRRWTKIKTSSYHNARTRYVEAFAEAALAGRRPDIGGEEGRQVLAAVLAAYESARTGSRCPIQNGSLMPVPADRRVGVAA